MRSWWAACAVDGIDGGLAELPEVDHPRLTRLLRCETEPRFLIASEGERTVEHPARSVVDE